MQTITSPQELSRLCREWHAAGNSVSLVPTMGYYHAGHEALMTRARELGDRMVVSLFVNPTQFGPNEDLSAYPRNLEGDTAIAEKHGTDVLFTPAPEDMYAPDAATWVEVPDLSGVLCGLSRPVHFRGVCTVCTKLFQITQADYACFGDKDWQQQAIIRRMVRDLFMPIRIVGVPTCRAEDGLALSSRNVYLTAEERAQAPQIYAGLRYARDIVASGETRVSVIRDLVLRRWARSLPLGRLDYLTVVHPVDMTVLDEVKGPALLACAVKMGKARLIDNILLAEA